jgi:hypothetical protein
VEVSWKLRLFTEWGKHPDNVPLRSDTILE